MVLELMGAREAQRALRPVPRHPSHDKADMAGGGPIAGDQRREQFELAATPNDDSAGNALTFAVNAVKPVARLLRTICLYAISRLRPLRWGGIRSQLIAFETGPVGAGGRRWALVQRHCQLAENRTGSRRLGIGVAGFAAVDRARLRSPCFAGVFRRRGLGIDGGAVSASDGPAIIGSNCDGRSSALVGAPPP
jgi:hypothetical protein